MVLSHPARSAHAAWDDAIHAWMHRYTMVNAGTDRTIGTRPMAGARSVLQVQQAAVADMCAQSLRAALLAGLRSRNVAFPKLLLSFPDRQAVKASVAPRD